MSRSFVIAAQCRAHDSQSSTQKNEYPPKELIHGNRDYKIVKPADFPQDLVDEHQAAYTTFAKEFEFVGPMIFNYAFVPQADINISISGDDHGPLQNFYHVAQREPKGEVYSRSLHEYFHLFQAAYGAPSKNTTGGDESEDWHFAGPRWWQEGSAVWIECVYPQLRCLPLETLLPKRLARARSSYCRASRASVREGRRITVEQTLNPNLVANPDWKLVDECDIYESHVYDGGLCAVDFALRHECSDAALHSLIAMIRYVEGKDDWEVAFLEWSGYGSMRAFYDAFDTHLFDAFDTATAAATADVAGSFVFIASRSATTNGFGRECLERFDEFEAAVSVGSTFRFVDAQGTTEYTVERKEHDVVVFRPPLGVAVDGPALIQVVSGTASTKT